MIALDTNVVVRVLAADEERQLQAALAVMRAGPLWLAKSVLLETEWVLRHSYRMDRSVVYEALRRLLGLEALSVEDSNGVLQALDGYRRGLDFADALHLASSSTAERFATFDRKLRRRAEELGASPPVDLLDA